MKNLEFKSLRNARDFGGMVTADGKKIRPGVIIRCASLYKLDKKDIAKLSEEYKVSKIFDLRSPHEKEKKPDAVIPGAQNIENPYFDADTLAMTSGMGSDVRSAIKRAENRQELIDGVPDLATVYPIMVTSDYAVSQMSKCIKIIFSNREGSVIFHCTAGKDRTGMTAAVILKLLGVSDEDILEDYMFTNNTFEKTSSFYSRLIRVFMRDKILAEKVRKVFLCDEQYIDAFFNAADERFGSFENFVSEGLGITQTEVEDFKNYILA